MPFFDYKCTNNECEAIFDTMRTQADLAREDGMLAAMKAKPDNKNINQAPLMWCPECGSLMLRKMNAVLFTLK